MQAITILGVLAAFCLLFLSLLALCAARGFRPLAGVRRFYGRLSVLGRVSLLVFVGAFIVYASTKSDDSTNAPPARMSAQRRSLAAQPGVVISEAETNLGYRVLAVRDGDEIVPPGIESVTNEAWRLRGGMMDAFRIGMDPEPTEDERMLPAGPVWCFPWRAAWTQELTVFANGEFQPSVRDDFFPRPFGTNLSLVPQAKWGEIADGSLESLFWHELTPSNSLVLTWQNALYGRDANAPTNFQAELFGDGSFDYRYPDRTVSYAPVFPFDWDGDGLENSVDPEPRIAGPDAHGTNAEWYNNVCSNVFVAVEGTDGLTLAPRHAGVNTNAYYFVDVVAERGPAPIYFTADGPSRLGNPVVVAQAGVTNRVPLLIGATYSVSSSVPISFVAKPVNVNVNMMEPNAEEGRLDVNYPLNMYYSEQNGFYAPMTDDPALLLGELNWRGGCCTHVLGGTLLSFQCNGCGCAGCTATLCCTYEGYTFYAQGPSCGCGSENVGGMSSAETTEHARISLGFDGRAIIFEDEYDDSPTRHIGRRSTEVSLAVRAYGGLAGGRLVVPEGALARLERVSGEWPVSRYLAPGESYEVISTNRGIIASAALRDVVASIDFIEDESGERIHAQSALTAVRVEVEPEKRAFENPCKNRHRCGVCEVVKLIHEPKMSDPVWQISGNALNVPSVIEPGISTLMLPVGQAFFAGGLSVTYCGTTYCPSISLVEPQGIVCTNCEWDEQTKAPRNARKNEAGWVGMYLTLYVTPLDVSFENIDVQEEPCAVESHSPYYEYLVGTDYISHTMAAGAGIWHCVGPRNYFTRDHASVHAQLTPWGDGGWHSWQIPHAWRQGTPDRKPWSNGMFAYGSFATDCNQLSTIDVEGTVMVVKHGHMVSRTTNNCVRVQGRIVYGRE